MNEEKQQIRLSHMFTTPLEEVIKNMELLDMKIHTDDSECVRSVELRYIPKGGKDCEPKREKRADSPSR